MNANETAYNPANANNRAALADAITAMLKAAGFTGKPCRDTSGEWVFERMLTADGSLVLQVWTGVVGSHDGALTARKAGADAIRASAVYRKAGERDRGVVSDTRVNRTGTIEGIVARTLDRMRDVWRNAKGVARCHCGAPMFKSKAGNMTCAALCWKGAQAAARSTALPAPRPARAAHALCGECGTAHPANDEDFDHCWRPATADERMRGAY